MFMEHYRHVGLSYVGLSADAPDLELKRYTLHFVKLRIYLLDPAGRSIGLLSARIVLHKIMNHALMRSKQ